MLIIVNVCFKNMQNYKNLPLGLSYDDVLLVPQYSEIDSRSSVNIGSILSPRIKLSIPMISTNMLDITDEKMAVAFGKLGGLGIIPRFVSIPNQVDIVKAVKKEGLPCVASVGLREGAEERADALIEAGVNALHLDVADGHLKKAIEFTRSLKSKYGKYADIMSGLVATSDGAERLFDAGADCVHVGIGGGSICITRMQTGCGVPNITTILDTAKVARKYKKSIVIDGGIKNTGDVVKALAAGASAVRCGYFLSGFTESPGKLIIKDGKRFKQYNGSTSLAEKKRHLKNIGNELSKNYTKHIEGVESMVPYKGDLKDFIEGAVANIRSGFSYSGARNLEDLWRKARFMRITPAGMRESGAHDVIVQ